MPDFTAPAMGADSALAGERRLSKARQLARILASVVLTVSLVVLAGWWLEVPAARRILPGQPPMVIPTAVAALLLASSLLLVAKAVPSSAMHTAGRCCAALACLIGAAGLIQPALPFRLDEWVHHLMSRPLEPGSGLAGASAACIVLAAAGLAFHDHRAGWLRRISMLCTLSGLVIAVVGVLGYAYEIGFLHESAPFGRMALLRTERWVSRRQR